jgi:transposase
MEDREEDYISAMGKTVIFSDMKGATPRQIVEIYDLRNKIETDIAWLKEKLLTIYVRKYVKIRAHVFLCVMGLLLYNYLLYIIADPTLSMEQLAHHLDLMRLGAVHIDREKGKRKKVEFVIEDMNKRTAEIFAKLQLGRYMPT